ncbi:dihydroorotase [Pricia antarctica]|uniref:Dihydroorotase n=1 Tax=Pricia antarctica TaxID=641691 RepID=A0A1G7HV39_9FLAO|nr:amidohydrolase/deacetylase family metallohydrolase [Pricia antarctica]SDF04330.1 dihydroorotase [Pricia antarctica]
MIKNSIPSIFLIFLSLVVHSQEIDILIKNGHVLDPKNNIDGIMDVAIADGKIAAVGKDLAEENVKTTIDATGLYVCPGLIDIHTHVFVGPKAGKFADGVNSVSPDDFSFKAGVTTVVDAGTSGWRNFPKFKEQVIDQSKTRVLAFLNIAADGISGTETTLSKIEAAKHDLDEMDVQKTDKTIREYPDIIVGVKIGHFDGESWAPFDRAVDAAAKTDRPLFVECHLPEYSLEDQLNHMRPGDIITHSFENIDERMPVVDENGKLRPFVLKAKDRGILFDVGHGGAGFWFDQAVPAFEQGLWPNSFGTDLHRFSMNAGMKNMLNVMSKFLTMGMPLKEVVLRGSWKPAQAIKRADLGNLDVGAVADIALLNLETGKFGFVDAGGKRITGNQKLEAALTVREGKVVWDLNGLAAQDFVRN